MTHLLILSLALIAFAAYKTSLADVWGPLRKVPGPFWARLTRLWDWSALLHRGRAYAHISQGLHRTYGPVVRLAPGRYSINDPKAAKQIYGHSSKFLKSDFYNHFGSDAAVLDVFSDRDVNRHAASRRRIATLYTMSTLKSYSSFIDDVEAQLMRRFSQMAAENKVFDFPDWMQYYAFDVIGTITLGEPFGILEAGFDQLDILSSIYKQQTISAHVGVVAAEWSHLRKKFDHTINKGSSQNKSREWVRARLREHRPMITPEKLELRSDFNLKCLALMQQGKISEDERYNVALQNIAAGSDTTGTALGAIGWYLGQSPDCVSKLRDEMKTFKEEGRFSDPVTFAEAQEMTYLQAVIKESLRMHPAAGMMLPRIVPKGGAELCGYYFPEGSVVGSNAWDLNYHPATFGSDADSFRPERWLEDPERAKHMEAAMFTFGGGARICIGKNVALLEISKLVPQLYRRFDFEVFQSGRSVLSSFVAKQHFNARVKLLDEPL